MVCKEMQSPIDLILRYTFVSSAYNATITASTVSSGRSLIKTVNNKRPRRLPRGTPEVTGAYCDAAPSMTTLSIRPPR